MFGRCEARTVRPRYRPAIAARYEAKPVSTQRRVARRADARCSARERRPISRRSAGCGPPERPSPGNRNVVHRQRLELDQRCTALARRQRCGVIHAAAARADELFAIGQNLHQLGEGGVAMVGAEQRQGDGHDQRGRGGESRGRRKVGIDGGVDAIEDSPFAGDGLSGGAQVIFPIAARDGCEARGPGEFAGSVGAR